jgi:hypothetical protein
MEECNCSPAADEILTSQNGDRLTITIGGEVGSVRAEILDQAHQLVAELTGMPTGESFHDRECPHGRPYSQAVVFADNLAQPEAGLPAIAYFGNAPTSAQGSAYLEALQARRR